MCRAWVVSELNSIRRQAKQKFTVWFGIWKTIIYMVYMHALSVSSLILSHHMEPSFEVAVLFFYFCWYLLRIETIDNESQIKIRNNMIVRRAILLILSFFLSSICSVLIWSIEIEIKPREKEIANIHSFIYWCETHFLVQSREK